MESKEKSPINCNSYTTFVGIFHTRIFKGIQRQKKTWLPQAILILDWSISKNLLWNCFAKMSRNFVGSTYGRFCIKFPQSRMKGERHRLSSVLSLPKRFQRKSCFRNRPIRNKNCLWRPCLLTDQNGMSNSNRGPSIDASYWLPQEILVLDWSISKNLLLWNCFSKMSRNLVESTYGRFCIKLPQSRMKGERHRLSSVLSL
jgi:hypothetical protein